MFDHEVMAARSGIAQRTRLGLRRLFDEWSWSQGLRCEINGHGYLDLFAARHGRGFQ